MDGTTTSNTLMKEELALTKQALAKAQEENILLKEYVRKESFETNILYIAITSMLFERK